MLTPSDRAIIDAINTRAAQPFTSTPARSAARFDALADRLEADIAARRKWLAEREPSNPGLSRFYSDADTPERRALIRFYRRRAAECRDRLTAAAPSSQQTERSVA